jgi:penicillin-binding protein 1A
MRHLDDNEMETFCRNQKNELEEAPLEKGMNLKGVIIKVDDGKREAMVKMGNELGVFSTSGVNWSSAPQADGNPGIDQTLRRGDVVLVSVRGIRKPGKDPDDIDPDDPKPESKVRIWGLDLQLTPNSEAALISIEAGTGLVKAMIGGRDFSDSQFNRAIQSKRQPGSSIKPIIYAAALDKGYTPASMIVDEPIVFMDDTGKETWRPRNYDNTFNGPTLFRRALARSMNTVTIRILKDIGLDYFTNYARNLGIVSPLANDLTIALGSSEVSLVELVSAYSVFNNLGELIEPVFITRIADKYGNILEDNTPVRKQVIDRSTAYIMTSLLQSVIQGGTASRVRKINRPAAGKTGTTNDQNDAWFVGYTPQLTTGVWVGNDIKIPLGQGETGAKAASPIWLGFMQRALKDKPAMPFVVPEGVVYAQIDADTGCRPSSSTDHIITECFKQGTGPRDCHSSGDDDFEDDGIGAGSGNGKAGGEKTSKDETTVLFKDGL